MNSFQLSHQVSKQAAAIELLARRQARTHLLDFVRYTMPAYQVNWHHAYLASQLDLFEQGHIKKLMVFMPPQTGKSQLVSRHLPAFLLGRNPDRKIVGASYSSDLSSSFNRDIQRIVDDNPYLRLFPDTYLNQSNVRTIAHGGYLRNSDIFEVVGHTGFYKSVGVGGSLTGTPADIAIIDDPIKDAVEAYSTRTRETVWQWYDTVLKTRLHNDSQQLVTLTRWHEEDLAGKILASEGQDWTVISFPALKESNNDPNDPRQIDEALWPEKHSQERMQAIRKSSPTTFASLYQQRPSPAEGNLIKRAWFDIVDMPVLTAPPTIDFVCDTAYTEDERNDETALIPYFFHNNDLYLTDAIELWEEFPELVKSIPPYCYSKGYTQRSKLFVEPKASGKSVVQQLRRHSTLNIIEDTPPKEDKVTRVMVASPAMEAHRVKLVKGSWNKNFLDRVGLFPNAKNKGIVDCLVMAVNKLEKPKFSVKSHNT